MLWVSWYLTNILANFYENPTNLHTLLIRLSRCNSRKGERQVSGLQRNSQFSHSFKCAPKSCRRPMKLNIEPSRNLVAKSSFKIHGKGHFAKKNETRIFRWHETTRLKLIQKRRIHVKVNMIVGVHRSHTFSTMFSCVTSWTHTLVSFVRKSNQASCVVIAHVEVALVLVEKYI